MTRARSSGRLVIWSLIAGLSASTARAADDRDVSVRTSVDRTAVWVADRVTYTITLTCRKGVDILADDLSRDKLRVEGLEVVGSDSERSTDRDARTTYAFRYVLAAYRVDLPELRIAPLAVRYYIKRPGQRLEDTAPAGEALVPPAVIAFRSALPDAQNTYALRDGRAARVRPMRFAVLQPLGVGLVLISTVPAAFVLLAALRPQRPRRTRRWSARQVRNEARASLDAVRAIDVSTPAGRRDAYARLDALVRDHVQQVSGIRAASLTPAEIEATLSQQGARMPVDLVTAVLSACEAAGYAPLDALPSSDACRQTIVKSEQIVGGVRS